MSHTIRFVPLVGLLVAAVANAQGKLELKPDRQNIAAARIAGEWEPDVALTTRLGGTALAGAANSSDPRVGGRIVIRLDPAVVGHIPEAMASQLLRVSPPLQIFAAGIMTFGGKDHPFLLVTMAGNPCVLYFREKNGDRFGDGESFLFALTPAKEPANDMLFVGGDFNNEPFSAFRRVGSAGTGGSSQTPANR